MPLFSVGLRGVVRLQAQLARSLGKAVRALPMAGQLGWAVGSASAPVEGSASADLHQSRISVVIPALNEARNLPHVLDTLQAASHVEVIVVDGGSSDDTIRVAADWGGKVVVANAGRSRQMNQGAAIATGPILLFLHADTRLPQGFDQAIRQILAQPGVVAGAFRLAIANSSGALRWVERGVNVRSKWLQMPYGDQAIFLTAEVFHALGGFPDLPMMEDFELVRRLRKMGKVAIAPAAVLTSDRRWRTLGILRTTLANQVMIAGYLLGIDPHQLARWYRHLGKPRQ
jgi:rSAM/selenodomain-associated transferase 2